MKGNATAASYYSRGGGTTSLHHRGGGGGYLYKGNPDDAADGIGVSSTSLKLLGPLAPVLLSNDVDDLERLRDRLRIFALSVMGTSAFFWTWALYNTRHLMIKHGGFDMGVFSFLGSGASSAFLLRSSLGGRWCCRPRRTDAPKDDDVADVYGRLSNGRHDDAAPNHAPPGEFLRAFAVLTQLAVVANYMLGILFAFTAGSRVYVYFATYCFVFSILWSIAAFSCWVLITVYREAVRRAYGDEYINGPPRPRSRGLLWRCLVCLMNRSTAGQYASNGVTEDEDDYREDDIDDELRALVEGGRYTSN